MTSTSPTAPPSLRAWRVAAAGVALVAFGLFGWSGASYPPITGDVWSAEIGAWQIANTGEPWIEDVRPDQLPADWEIEAIESDRLFTYVNPTNGHRVVGRSPGAILAGVPAYFVDSLVRPDADERLSSLPGSLTAAAITAAALGFLVAALRGLVPLRGAILAAAAVGVTTPYWTVVGRDLWPHCIAVLGAAGMAWALSRERWLLAGVMGGLALGGRTHFALAVAVVGIMMALTRREPRIAVRIAAGSLPFVALCSLWSKLVYDSWRPTGGYNLGRIVDTRSDAMSVSFYLENLAGILVSPGYGLLVWTPAILVLLPSIVRGWRDFPDWSRVLAVGGLVYLLAQVAISVNFTGGTGFWGYRLSLEALTCLVPLLVLAAQRTSGTVRHLLFGVIGLQGAAIALGALFHLARTDADGSGWSSNNVLLAFDENPPATVIILALGTVVALVVAHFAGRARVGGHEAD